MQPPKNATFEKLSSFLDTELRVVVKYLKNTKGLVNIKESATKGRKLEALDEVLSLDVPSTFGTKAKCIKKIRCRNPCTLHELAFKAVYCKHELNVFIAEMEFPAKHNEWKQDIKHVHINDITQEWFYKLEFSLQRMQLEVKCINSTHLLTRTRRKTCVGGIEKITNEPWVKVAK